MDSFEMRALQDTSRVVEKMADFAGSVILQLLQKQGYVEKQGIKALLDHIRDGGGTLTTIVSKQRAEDFKELLKKEHIPYVEIEHVDPQTKERSIFFVYRDCDQTGVKEVLKQFEITLDQSCHEVDLDTFTAMTDKKPYGTVYGLTKTEAINKIQSLHAQRVIEDALRWHEEKIADVSPANTETAASSIEVF